MKSYFILLSSFWDLYDLIKPQTTVEFFLVMFSVSIQCSSTSQEPSTPGINSDVQIDDVFSVSSWFLSCYPAAIKRGTKFSFTLHCLGKQPLEYKACLRPTHVFSSFSSSRPALVVLSHSLLTTIFIADRFPRSLWFYSFGPLILGHWIFSCAINQASRPTTPSFHRVVLHHHLATFETVDPSWIQTGSCGPLDEYDWSLSSTSCVPAGQHNGKKRNNAPDLPEHDGSITPDPSLPQNQENVERGIEQRLEANTPIPGPVDRQPNALRCSECGCIHTHRYSLNRCKVKHLRPFKCGVGDCAKGFYLNKDCVRHRKAKHPETVGNITRYFCPYSGCKHAEGKGHGWLRKDNWRRHVNTQHRGLQKAR
ncbi:Putative Zinc finger C2H2-type [Colletotrichum destructivum]|uniref:Zinc finger C2H2-type n=1 Tax=Colletotrichum destructivum TaxID=34406 RepID=A0AAX4I2M3_9PEZI|nr:Putative Zinc finger C2H2-type [Colletotrichum destructivum]